jgi:hypothetical protein
MKIPIKIPIGLTRKISRFQVVDFGGYGWTRTTDTSIMSAVL